METINFLLDRPVALFLVLAFGAVIGIAVERLTNRAAAEKRKAYWRGRNAAKSSGNVTPLSRQASSKSTEADFAADQLKLVSKAAFTSRALLNRAEAAVFAALDKAVIARNPGWQVMAQVSLGEFLATADKEAFLAVNSKRVDFALMDEKCCVRHALEYQGSGHHLGQSAAARDAVKKEALRKAGIGYHEVVAGHTTPGELKRLVERLVPEA
jgi:very-short-patch-repair endonuclease